MAMLEVLQSLQQEYKNPPEKIQGLERRGCWEEDQGAPFTVLTFEKNNPCARFSFEMF